MKVLHLSMSSPRGGAAIGALRLHASLRELGVESRFMGALPAGARDETLRPWRQPPAGERLLEKVTWRLGLNSIHALGTWSLMRDPWFQWADVVHLHNLHGEAFSYLALPALARQKPLVWTLHDMWAITGHCGFSLGCDRWRTGCGRCPHLDVYPYAARDATRWEWRLKRHAVNLARPRLAAPSRWLCRMAGEAFPELAPVHHIPYSIDTTVFSPESKAIARAELGLPADRLLLLSAASDLAETRKGGHLLSEALRGIPDELMRRTGLLTMGGGSGSWPELRAREVPVFALGFLEDPGKQALVYSAADLLLFPSMDDNLPFVVIEALACGLPAVAFDVGGVGELVINGQTGFLVPPFDVGAYTKAVESVITMRINCGALGGNARAHAAGSYRAGLDAGNYMRLYEEAANLGPRRRRGAAKIESGADFP